MNIEKYIREQFFKYGAELKINYLQSNGTYRIRVPKSIQDSLNLKQQYYGSTKQIALKKIFDELGYINLTNITLKELFDEWHEERCLDIDISLETTTKDEQLFRKWIQENSSLANRLVKSQCFAFIYYF